MNPVLKAPYLLQLLWPRACLVCRSVIRSEQLCSNCELESPLRPGTNRCAVCFDPRLPHTDSICTACQQAPPVFGSVRYYWNYSGNIRAAIIAMKYYPSYSLADLLAQRLVQRAGIIMNKQAPDLVVPVPVSASSMWKRGFNQCLPIATAVCHKLLRRPLQSRDLLALIHRGFRPSQASLRTDRRIDNVKQAFSSNKKHVRDQSILLVDDVLTTGATATACALALKNAGAKDVSLLCLAAAAHWSTHRWDIRKMYC